MKPSSIFWPATIILLASSGWAATNAFPAFQLPKAREYLQTLSDALPAEIGTNADTFFLQAQTESQLGLKREAEGLARQALRYDPQRADIQLFLASLFVRQDRLSEAAACLRTAVQIQPSIPTGYSQLGMVLDRLGDHQGAQEAFSHAIELNPRDSTARLLAGRSLLDQGQIEAAIQQLQKACELDPALAGARYALFQAQTRHGDQEAARQNLRLFEQLKQKEQADMDAENTADDSEQDLRKLAASFHIGAAKLLGRQGRQDQAEAHLVQATKIAPEQPEAYEVLAEFYRNRQQLYSARKVLEELTRLRPKSLTHGVNLGTVLVQLRDYPAAITEFKRILAIDPKDPAALNNLTRVYLGERRELGEALAMSRQLVAGNPNGANYDLLAWACYANGRTNEALQACANAVQTDPSNTVFRQHYLRLLQAADPAH